MRPLKGSFVLENVFFDVDKAVLKKESVTELTKLAGILKENPALKIELGGHTDSDGDDKHNQILSENRAEAVVNWLITQGIDKTRLTYKGYGETQPIMVDGKEDKARSRRTEVTIK